jgi:hypothetical protein
MRGGRAREAYRLGTTITFRHRLGRRLMFFSVDLLFLRAGIDMALEIAILGVRWF